MSLLDSPGGVPALPGESSGAARGNPALLDTSAVGHGAQGDPATGPWKPVETPRRGKFSAAQRAELRDAAARSRVEAQKEGTRIARVAQERKAAERAEQRKLAPPARKSRLRHGDRYEVLPPKTAAVRSPTKAELELADRLAPHICPQSVIDRRAHALGVARLVLNGRLGGQKKEERNERSDGSA